MARKPDGAGPLSNAQKQARYRTARKGRLAGYQFALRKIVEAKVAPVADEAERGETMARYAEDALAGNFDHLGTSPQQDV